MYTPRQMLLVLIATICITAVSTAAILHRADDDSEVVYLIGAVTITDEGRLPEYQMKAGPAAARRGGYVPLAYNFPNMIEGAQPVPGRFFIERYDSIESLRNFVDSPEFRELKPLRDEVANVHFMMWLPAVPAHSLPH